MGLNDRHTAAIERKFESSAGIPRVRETPAAGVLRRRIGQVYPRCVCERGLLGLLDPGSVVVVNIHRIDIDRSARSPSRMADLQSVKGIGVRTAKRLVLELKDKLEWAEVLAEAASTSGVSGTGLAGSKAQDLIAALVALGYPRFAAREAAAKALQNFDEEESLENLIKAALLNI